MAAVVKVNTFMQDKAFGEFSALSFVYKLIYFIGGFDYGFVKLQPIYKKIWVFFLCCLHYYLTVGQILNDDSIKGYWNMLSLFQYFLFVFLLLAFKTGATFCDFFSEWDMIDLKLGKNKDFYRIEFKLLMTLLFCFTYRAFIFYIYCLLSGEYCVEPYTLVFVNTLELGIVETIMISFTFVFYAIKCRMQYLLSIIKSREDSFESLQCLYKNMFDIAEKYKRGFEPVYLTSLVFCIPTVMSTIYILVFTTLYDDGKHKLDTCARVAKNIEYFFVIWSLLFVFMPAFQAGALAAYANKMNLILHDKLLSETEQDPTTAYEIKRFISYIKACPFKFSVYKLVPLNEQLLGMVLQFCVTYLIVIVQFTIKL